MWRKLSHIASQYLGYDSTLFHREIDPETTIKNAKVAVIEDIGEAVSQLVTDFFTERVKMLDEETVEKDD